MKTKSAGASDSGQKRSGNEDSWFADASRVTITASQGCQAIALDAEAFKRLTQQDPWFGIGVLERLGKRMSQQLDRLEDARLGG